LGVSLRVGLSALVPPKYGATPLLSLTHRNTPRISIIKCKKQKIPVSTEAGIL
jgi:hypothetical protein